MMDTRLVIIVLVAVTQWHACEAAVYGESCDVNNTCDEAQTECQSGTCGCDASSFRNTNTDACETKVNLGDSCSGTGQCAVANSECTSGTSRTCQCISSYYQDGSSCSPKVNLGDNCSGTGQCAVANSECTSGTSGTCQCISSYYQDGSSCSPKVNLGDSCSGTGQCAVANSECTSGTSRTCQCISSYYQDGSSCSPKVNLGDNCSGTGQCAVANSECTSGTSGTCQCTSSYYQDGSSCSPKVNLGDNCSGTGQCAVANSECTSGTSGTCQCISSYYQDGSSCSPKVILGDNCSGTGQCAVANSECTSGTCQCTSSYYQDGSSCSPKVNLGDNCSGTGQCAVANSECTSGTSGTCQCTSSYYQDGSSCSPKVNLGDNCSGTGQCAVANSECTSGTSGTCQCISSYYQDGSSCSPKLNLGGSCSGTGQCAVANSECTSGTCQCTSSYYQDGSSCSPKVNLGDNCSGTGQCAVANSECTSGTSGTCQCISSYYQDGSSCSPKLNLGGSCSGTGQCAVANSECTSGTCQCTSSYYQDGSSCSPKVNLGDNCSGTGQCAVANSECTSGTSGTCQCISSYYQDGSSCSPKVNLGDNCSGTGQCAVANSECTSGTSRTCQCISSYYQDGSSCSPKVNLGDSCSGTGQCAVANSECTSGTSRTCQCISSYYQDGSSCSPKVNLGDNCSGTGQCAVANSECTSGTSGTCQCISSYYQDGSSCSPKVNLGDSCSGAGQCAVANSECTSGTSRMCQCISSYYQDGSSCSPKLNLGASCSTGQCADSNSECTGTCQCKSTHYRDGSSCMMKLNLGSGCLAGQCADANSECASGTCQCKSTHYKDGSSCRLKLDLNQQCVNSLSGQCSDENAECQYSNQAFQYRCLCQSGYSVSDGTCNPDQGVGEVCLTDGAGDCSDANAECTNNVCICKTNFYHDRGLLVGGNCRDVNELQVWGLVFTDVQLDRFTVTWNAPTGKSVHVSGYRLQWWPKGNSVGVGGGSADVGNATSHVATTAITPGKAYEITVTSRNEVTEENSPRTVTSQVEEQAAKPNVPGILNRDSTDFNLDADDKRINLAWSPAAGSSSGYTVKMLEGASELDVNTFYTSQGSIYYSGMLNGHRYNISIRTLSQQFDNGKTVASDTIVEEVKTVVQEPGPPKNVRCLAVFDTYITLQWDKPNLLNGEVAEYHITAKTYSTSTVITKTSASTTTTDVQGLSPGSYYKFEVIVENEEYNSSIARTLSYCKTKAKMSDSPTSLQASDVTSRSFDVSWSDPVNTYSLENFGYVLQIKDSEGLCVKEEIYRCSDCTETFQVENLLELCPGTPEVINKAKSELSGIQTFRATGLNPDIVYDVTVTAINGAGRGHKASINATTLEETPAKPAIVNIDTVRATSFTVTWSIAGPRPGQTVYTIEVNAASPAPNMTVTIPDVDFNIRAKEIIGLEEYWDYTVTVTATTGNGSTTSDVSPSVTTNPSAPGQVSNFRVDRTPDRNYDSWEVTWKIPTILERNSDITGYRITHNGTNAVSQKEVGANAQEDYTYRETVVVVPENFYYVEVVAVNSLAKVGTATTYSQESLAGVPKPPRQANFQAIQAPSTNLKTIKITIDRDFLLLNTTGTPRATGLLCCAQAKCDGDLNALSLTQEDMGYKSMSLNNFRAVDTWYTASKKGFSLYRPTKDTWVDDFDAQSADTGRRRRAVDEDITYTIGEEQCTSENPTDSEYCNGPLKESTSFGVFVVVCTNGGCLISPQSGPYATLEVPTIVETDIPMIVGIVVGVVVVLAIVFVVIMFVMRRRRNNPPMKPIGDSEIPPMGPVTKNIPRKRPVQLSEFNDHLEKMHRDSNLMFSSEYEDIKALCAAHSQDAANKEENRLKNRYINILPFDHSIVKLSSNGEDDCQDFINANYLPGYKSQREYIGCQGPIPGTIDDHWRMIWEQSVSVIVMLTLCKEGQKVKCEQYWPDEVKEPKQYGDIIVEVSTYSNLKTYDYRIFSLTVGTKTMTVKHFHFLSWMDFSANVQTSTMIDFIKQVRAYVQPPDTAGPIIVHCSAGVGRTGTYVTLDHLMQFIEDHDVDRESVDIFSMVLALRDNRPHMVQTEQQYIFIHDCLKEIIERKRISENIYENRGFDANEEDLYQNEQAVLYENINLSGEPKTIL